MNEQTQQPRRTVKFFVCHGHQNEKETDRFLDELKRQLAPSRRYRFDLWGDWRILAGDRWHEEIQRAIASCDFGLLLVSPDFLASDYITREELPHFVSGRKPLIPVGLVRVDLQTHDLKGLEAHQIFLYKPGNGRNAKWFDECNRGNRQHRSFAEQLHQIIEKRLDFHFEPCLVAGREARISTK